MPAFASWLMIAVLASALSGCIPIPFSDSEPLPEGFMLDVPADLRSDPAEVLVLQQLVSVSGAEVLGGATSPQQGQTVVSLSFAKGTELVSLERKLKSFSSHGVAWITGGAPGVFPVYSTEKDERLQTLCVLARDGRFVRLSPLFPAEHGMIDATRRDAAIAVLRTANAQQPEINDGPCGISGRLDCTGANCARAADFLSQIAPSIPPQTPSR